MTRKKNPFGKTVDIESPYAIYTGPKGFEWRILKTYQTTKNEKKNPYARWFVAAKSEMTGGAWEYGDTYVKDILNYGILISYVDGWDK